MGHCPKWWGLIAPIHQSIAKSEVLAMTFKHR